MLDSAGRLARRDSDIDRVAAWPILDSTCKGAVADRK
jgi:hypothetical protein